MDDQELQHAAAMEVARKCLETRFIGARYLFATGSILRGQGTSFSDIDLVVVFPKLERAWRESFILDGFPVEAFVHDSQTLAYYMEKDVEGGCPTMLSMVATGAIVGPSLKTALAIQTGARRALAEGPRPLAGPAYDTMRYLLSDLADDLRGDRPGDEIAAIAALLYPLLIDFILIGRGQWTGRGKWGPRLLRQFDAHLGAAITQAFAAATRGDSEALLGLADAELERHGGRYFDGYRMLAPLDARIQESAS
ncbi:nucleotidyltransferase domain-containing protein [Pseudaminobacter soli (ex Li et al. 2025)]|uniref:Nucleotidyltransferase n=1 Tax=Pseudaminobacter soli (ex Li et al. 2025) TaxID=1295366 RepID=A0A2P7S5D0_9HYPH|nr:nucleotidyltransferase domain-containing protein [Mesorhizobium soli]PSJ57663.1 nucleotidyltransferase [Mesorhizobium soli]